MKKMMLITFILMLSTFSLYAPAERVIKIVTYPALMPFELMLKSFMYVESSYRTDVVNSLGYTGILQIGQEMTDEANRLCIESGNPIRYKFPESALDSLQSTQIWYIVQGYHNPTFDLKKACYIWNPLASEKYYLKVEAAL